MLYFFQQIIKYTNVKDTVSLIIILLYNSLYLSGNTHKIILIILFLIRMKI